MVNKITGELSNKYASAEMRENARLEAENARAERKNQASADDVVNTVTGEVMTGDEYADMILRQYEEANAYYRDAREARDRARMNLFHYMDEQGSDGIPSETYHVRRKKTYDYTKNKAGFLPLLEILNSLDLEKVYTAPKPADGKWNVQQIKALVATYPRLGEILEMVREATVSLEFNRREDGK